MATHVWQAYPNQLLFRIVAVSAERLTLRHLHWLSIHMYSVSAFAVC